MAEKTEHSFRAIPDVLRPLASKILEEVRTLQSAIKDAEHEQTIDRAFVEVHLVSSPHRRISEIVLESLIDEYGPLCPWTVDDVCGVIFRALTLRGAAPKDAYQNIVDGLARVSHPAVSSSPFPIGVNLFRVVLLAGRKQLPSPVGLWNRTIDNFHYSIELCGAICREPEEALYERIDANWRGKIKLPMPINVRNDLVELYATTRTNCQSQVARQFDEAVRRVLPTLIACFVDLVWDYQPQVPGVYLVTARQIPITTNRGEIDPELQRFLVLCLGSYFSPDAPGKKRSYDQRIQIAITLLAQADNSAHPAISLSLCIAAIEALLGESTQEISRQLSESIAALLEPMIEHRSSAEQYFRRLYDSRSKALHGSQLHDSSDEKWTARRLASEVLWAILERREFMRKSGFETDSPKTLLDELRAQKYRHGQPAPLSERKVTSLWRKLGEEETGSHLDRATGDP